MRPTQSPNVVINPTHKRAAKAVLQTIKKLPQINKQLIETALMNYDADPVGSLTQIRSDQTIKQIFDDHILEFNCWNESFHKVVEILGKQKEVQKIDIVQKLIGVQSTIKSRKPQNSYFTHVMVLVKKEFKLADDFLSKWREEKIKIYEKKMQKLQQKIKPESRQNIPQSQPQPQPEPQQPQPLSSSHSQPLPSIQQPFQQKPSLLSSVPQSVSNPLMLSSELQKQLQPPKQGLSSAKQRERKALQKQRQIEKLRYQNQLKFRKNKQNRYLNIVKYLESRKQFTYGGSKDLVAKEILGFLERFMKEKIQKIIKYSKMRYPGYNSQQAGDQFRMYSSKSPFLHLKHPVSLPETDTKFLKLKYPSKLQSYLSLRIEQQKQQQKIKSQLKQKIESDKKTDKLIQTYLIADQKQNFVEFQRDDGPKKKERLFVLPQVIQFVIEGDLWFGDRFVMEKTFFRGAS